MEDLYRTYGYYQNALENFTFEGEDGMKQMEDHGRGCGTAPKEIAGCRVAGSSSDYQTARSGCRTGAEEPLSLPKSNVLEYRLENGSKVMVRPSGTAQDQNLPLGKGGFPRGERCAHRPVARGRNPLLRVDG